ncbi:hypothetical protein [Paenibacillus cineris]|uniref:Uncharacterized protein n=1 Tax=Paenibacillus cineris TaxID=237530 RepID=A0ABQ4LN87_9BACL|nr:hypothetical protein [Paenibacillus cineris]GIO57976.1 hypothetical protein J21TS7_62940 [Paenibacillus cineris]
MNTSKTQYSPQDHNRYFAGFVFTNYEYKSLYQSWKSVEGIDLQKAFELGGRLFLLMVETGYYKINEPE